MDSSLLHRQSDPSPIFTGRRLTIVAAWGMHVKGACEEIRSHASTGTTPPLANALGHLPGYRTTCSGHGSRFEVPHNLPT